MKSRIVKPLRPIFYKLTVAFLDIGGFIFSFTLNNFLRIKTNAFVFDPFSTWLGPLVILLLTYYVFDVFKPDSNILGVRASWRLIIAGVIAGICIFTLTYLIQIERSGFWGRGILVPTLCLSILWSFALRFPMEKWWKAHSEKLRWLVIAHQECLEPLLQDIKKFNLYGDVFFLLDKEQAIDGFISLGNLENLSLCSKQPWSGIIIATSKDLSNVISEELMKIRLRGIRIYNVIDFYEWIWQKIPISFVQNIWIALSNGFTLLHNPLGFRLKRILDISFSIILILFSSIIMILAYVAIKLEDKGPCFFSQIRVGLNGKYFTIYKFRSMVIEAEKDGPQWAQIGDQRVTKVGRLLRKTRLDELPQLWNILKGDMSFIGPRPERPEFTKDLSKIIPFYDLRHLIMPGLTGWAQVKYPYGASVQDALEKLQYDLYYIKHYSLFLDIMISLKTFKVILCGRGR